MLLIIKYAYYGAYWAYIEQSCNKGLYLYSKSLFFYKFLENVIFIQDAFAYAWLDEKLAKSRYTHITKYPTDATPEMMSIYI